MINKYKILKLNPLFHGVKLEDIPNVLNCLSFFQRDYKKEDTIFKDGNSSRYAAILLSGQLDINMITMSGHNVILKRIYPGEIFILNPSINYEQFYYIYENIIEDSILLLTNITNVFNTNKRKCPFRIKLLENLLKITMEDNLRLQMKVSILTQKSLREKILTYLMMSNVNKKNIVVLPFNRQDFADFLSVERSALCRELGRMQRDGLIAMNGKKIHILTSYE